MHIWTLTNWTETYDLDDKEHRSGLYTRFEKGIDPEIKKECLKFCEWLRKEYFFPIRVPVYFKKSRFIKAMDGENVSATFFEPYNKQDEPYIRVATGDYMMILNRYGKINALGAVLGSIAHELTHYFQWVNDIRLTEIGYERQATMYARYIVDEYFDEIQILKSCMDETEIINADM